MASQNYVENGESVERPGKNKNNKIRYIYIIIIARDLKRLHEC